MPKAVAADGELARLFDVVKDSVSALRNHMPTKRGANPIHSFTKRHFRNAIRDCPSARQGAVAIEICPHIVTFDRRDRLDAIAIKAHARIYVAMLGLALPLNANPQIVARCDMTDRIAICINNMHRNNA